MMRHSLRVLLLMPLLGACATFNPFKSNRSTDYNALTYGEEGVYGANRQGRWGGASVGVPRPSVRNEAGEALDARTAALSRATENPIEEVLDPAEDSVRARIEARRGQVAAKGRGDRVTRADFFDNAPSDGSLWATENDGNYFFTKGKVRTVGDIVSVKLDDSMVKQVAEEIKKSLTPAEQEVEMALYLRNTEGAKNDQDLKAYRNVASDDLNSEAEEVKQRMEKAVRWSQVDLSNAIGLAPAEELRAEIVDRYQNGNFKIRAVKRVLYRGASKMVSLIGVAPVADFDEKDMISSGKLYEYKIQVTR